MNAKKIILISVGVVVVLLIAGVLIVFSRIDAIVKQTVESEGTAQLDLATTLRDADVSIFGGSVTLDRLAIANPEGYRSPVMFEMGQVSVGVSYRDLAGEPVRVRDIRINSPRLVIERSGEGLANLANVNLRELMQRLDSGAEQSQERTTKLLIGQLTVTGTEVVIRPNIEGLNEEYSLRIPDVTLAQIGTADEAQNGAEIGRVAAEVALALARKAAESEELAPELRALLAGDLQSIVDEYKDKLGERVEAEMRQQLGELEQRLGTDLTDTTEKLLKGDTAGAAEEVKQKAGDAVGRELEKGLGGLLGRRGKPGDPATQSTSRPADR